MKKTIYSIASVLLLIMYYYIVRIDLKKIFPDPEAIQKSQKS